VSSLTAHRVPLSVLELAPVSDGGTAGEALATALAVAELADEAGYRRIWFAEHHVSTGVVSAAPAVLAALAAARTGRIRVGSGAVLLAHTSPALAVEQFATIARLHPGRVDLGLGRSGTPPAGSDAAREPTPGSSGGAPAADRVVDGLLVPAPPPFSFSDAGVRRRFADGAAVVGLRTDVPDYRAELRLALDLLGPGHRLGSEVVRSGVGSGSGVEVWALASSPGESARAAGELGLPLAANYHVAPSSVLETVAAYRAAFRPGVLDRPYVIVSADVLVATTQDRARALARGFEDWVLGVRSADGAVAYPRPDRARLTWSDAELALVADRSRTRFVGDGPSVVAGLDALRLATAADEVLVTTIAHDPEARLDSFRLLAAAWATP